MGIQDKTKEEIIAEYLELQKEHNALKDVYAKEKNVRKQFDGAVHENDEKYRIAISASRLGTWDWDILTGKLSWSDACKNMFGIPLDLEMKYEHFFNALHPEDRESVNDITWKSLNEKTDYNYEYRVVWHDGSTHWIKALGCGIYDDADKPVRMLGVAMDVTERKNAEEMLRESEASFRAIFEGAPDAIVLVNPETRKILSVNQSTVRLLGKPVEEIIGMYQYELHPPQDIAYSKTTFQQHIEEIQTLKATHPIENAVYRADGTTVPVEILAQLIRIRNENVLMGTFRDITERKNAEKLLKESEKKFRELFEANSDGITIFSINPSGPPSKIIDLNENAARMLGYKKEEMLMLDPSLLEKDSSLEKVEKRKNDLLARGFSSFETILFHKDGHEINVEMKVIYILYTGQLAIMNITRDITDRKINEIQLQKRTNELTKLNSDKDRFLSVLAHDLKSPFNSILGFLELLSKNIRNYDIDKVENQINTIYRSTQNIYRLMDELLIWASSRSNALSFEPETLNLSTVCCQVLESLQLVSNAKNVSINYSEANEVTVFADKEMLKTILRNLISNAIKYSYPNGQINISATQLESIVTIYVADNGTGIEPEKMNKLFDISQIHSTKGTANEVGSGLGLLICKEYVEKQGGQICATSESGKGSLFYFTLPSGLK